MDITPFNEQKSANQPGPATRSLGLVTPAAPLRQIFTLNETHTFGTNVVNEARAGFNRFSSSTTPNAQLNPADFGILNGVSQPIGLPQISVAGGGLEFRRPVRPAVGPRRYHVCRGGHA